MHAVHFAFAPIEGRRIRDRRVAERRANRRGLISKNSSGAERCDAALKGLASSAFSVLPFTLARS